RRRLVSGLSDSGTASFFVSSFRPFSALLRRRGRRRPVVLRDAPLQNVTWAWCAVLGRMEELPGAAQLAVPTAWHGTCSFPEVPQSSRWRPPMISACLFLLPLVPLAAFRAVESRPG